MNDKPKTWKRPESILVVIHTRAARVLLMERKHPRGFWQSVTGSLEWGETARDAAIREVFEETGLDARRGLIDCHRSEIFPIIPPWRERYAPDVLVNREHAFLLPLPSGLTIRPNPAEHVACRWLPWQLAMRRASSWTNRLAIRLLAESRHWSWSPPGDMPPENWRFSRRIPIPIRNTLFLHE